MSKATHIELLLEVDSTDELENVYGGLFEFGEGDARFTIRVGDPQPGNGFGLNELLTVALEIGVGVTIEVVAAAITATLKTVIRRVRGKRGESDGSPEGIEALVELELSGNHDADDDQGDS